MFWFWSLVVKHDSPSSIIVFLNGVKLKLKISLVEILNRVSSDSHTISYDFAMHLSVFRFILSCRIS
jgi:hypothetical protein